VSRDCLKYMRTGGAENAYVTALHLVIQSTECASNCICSNIPQICTFTTPGPHPSSPSQNFTRRPDTLLSSAVARRSAQLLLGRVRVVTQGGDRTTDAVVKVRCMFGGTATATLLLLRWGPLLPCPYNAPTLLLTTNRHILQTS
jgi:hypothetical protein